MASTRAVVAGYIFLVVAVICGGFILVSPYAEYASTISSLSVAMYSVATLILPGVIKILGKKSMRTYIISAAIISPIVIGCGVAAACVVAYAPGLPSIVICIVSSLLYALGGIVIGGRYIQGGTRAEMSVALATWIEEVVKEMKAKGFLPDKFIEKAETLGLLGVRRPLDERLKNGGEEMKTIKGNVPLAKVVAVTTADDASFTSEEDAPATTTIPLEAH
jgi:hypothetical protein